MIHFTFVLCITFDTFCYRIKPAYIDVFPDFSVEGLYAVVITDRDGVPVFKGELGI